MFRSKKNLKLKKLRTVFWRDNPNAEIAENQESSKTSLSNFVFLFWVPNVNILKIRDLVYTIEKIKKTPDNTYIFFFMDYKKKLYFWKLNPIFLQNSDFEDTALKKIIWMYAFNHLGKETDWEYESF